MLQLNKKTRQKIERKREYFFSRVPPETRLQIQMDEAASYNVTEMNLAEETTQLILSALGSTSPANATITDATAGVGGNTASFSKHFARVNAVEVDETRVAFLRNNMALLCPKNNVTIYQGDYASAEIQGKLTQKIVFFDPPWGGVGYDKQSKVELFLSGKPLAEVCRGLRGRTRLIVLKLPWNFAFDDFLSKATEGGVLWELKRKEMGRMPGRNPKFVIMILRCMRPAVCTTVNTLGRVLLKLSPGSQDEENIIVCDVHAKKKTKR